MDASRLSSQRSKKLADGIRDQEAVFGVRH
jgi:hypothetical protein